jgi:hypothetical protein
MDYIHAAASGANVGLQRAGIDTGANEAADRLRFGYAQLAAEQERAKATLAAQEQQASAADRLRQAAQASEMAHQQAQLQQQALLHSDALGEKKREADAMLLYRGDALKQQSTLRTDALKEKKREADASLQLKKESTLTSPEILKVGDREFARISPNRFELLKKPVDLETKIKDETLKGTQANLQKRLASAEKEEAALIRQQISDIEKQRIALLAKPSAASVNPAAGAGKQFKDKSGKLWIYLGTAEDPTTDKDKTHWQEGQ